MPSNPIACCVCGETSAAVWRVSRDNLLGGPEVYRAVRCTRCQTRRLDPRPDASEMERFYAPTTYARAEEGESEVGRRLDAYNDRAAQRASAFFPHGPGRVLDVGCGDGRFLAQMTHRGWQAEGTETDAVAAALARRRTGGVIHEATLETADLPPASFDLVTLFHVLEHVPDPRETLASCYRLLRPGGFLLLALPNAASLEATLFGSAWYHLDLPRHLWGFTPHTLSRLVEENGFGMASLRYFPFLFAPQSVLNVLRNLRRKGGAKSLDTGARGRGGKRMTQIFMTMLDVSERAGRALPGEIMELAARRPAAEPK